MQNFLLMNPSKYVEELSMQFGYSETLFIEQDFVIIEGENRKKVLQEAHKFRDKIVIYRAKSEEMLRFVLEKTPVNIVINQEHIHPRDSLHYLRSGLDQVLCKIAADKGKTMGFAFSDLAKAKDQGKLFGRAMANIGLCEKYRVKAVFLTFFQNGKEFRSAHDLQQFWQVLQQGNRNIYK